MLHSRRAIAGIVTLGALLCVLLPGAGLAQGGTVTYTDGAAQLLVRVGSASVDTFRLVSGARDATAGTLKLDYSQVDGPGTLSILTPDLVGIHSASPQTPQSAAVTWKGVHGMSGARGTCTVGWDELSPTLISGGFSCPHERARGKKPAPLGVVGTFAARAAAEDGVLVDPAMPIYPLGTPVEAEGQTVTPTGFADLPLACIKGVGRASSDCPAGRRRVPGTFRAITLSVCVSLDGEQLRLTDRRGTGRALYAGAPEAPLLLGLPAVTLDPAVTSPPIRRVADPDGCIEGYTIAGTQGPLLVWTPPNGAQPVGWTLDPVALPPTADAPEGPGGASGSPSPRASATPAGRISFASGAADLLHDGAQTTSLDDLVLTEGWRDSDGAGTVVLHLGFASGGGTLTLNVPGATGSFTWDAGASRPDQGVSYTLGDLAVTPTASGCEVDVTSTDRGGVQGSYACLLESGGSASGSFIANP